MGKKNQQHGMTKERIYRIYRCMKTRCYNPNDSSYKDYGGRGITICDEWNNDFLSFYEWSMKNGYAENLSIDRIDNDGNYEPSNCRWATSQMQADNKRNVIKFVLDGKERTLRELSEEYGVNYRTLHARIKRGMLIDEALKVGEYRANGYETAKIDLETGEVLAVYESARKAAQENGMSNSSGIQLCCAGKAISSGGFGWEYTGERKQKRKTKEQKIIRKIDTCGRIAIPKDIAEKLKIQRNSEVEITIQGDGIFIRKVSKTTQDDTFMCDNEDSEGYGLETQYDDFCDEFEEMED